MDERYSHEIKEFQEAFSMLRDKRIVLYGIGRLTATILSSLSDHFVFTGLMDKEPDNLGKRIHGIEVIGLEKAEKTADLIIINTHEMYWNIIYKRIENSAIPIYFRNGEVARTKEERENEDDYWNTDFDYIYQKSKEYDIVSFDIFDTLISRKVLTPGDVFLILEQRAKKKGIDADIASQRSLINGECINNLYSIDDIYDELQNRTGISYEEREYLQKEELKIEKEVIYPRESVIKLLTEISKMKKCYLISDMYYTQEVIRELIPESCLNESVAIWISIEKGATKQQGSLWEKFKSHIGGKKVLHIGDNIKSDIVNPQKYGIDTVRICSPFALWEKSSFSDILPLITTRDAMFAGLIASRFFADPFCLSSTKGRVVINKNEDLGYLYFGGTILSFFDWLIDQTRNGKGRFFFFARDGYWLLEDYNYYRRKRTERGRKAKEFKDAKYLAISRRLALASAVDEPDGWEKLLSFSYVGDYETFVYMRLGYSLKENDPNRHERIMMPADYEKVDAWLEPIRGDIISKLKKDKEYYIRYLEHQNVSANDYYIDLWLNGNNQFYLSKVLHKNLTGMYFAANTDETNPCARENTLIPCFQDKEDTLAENCFLYKQAIFVESFLTAPYGMILSVNEDLELKCAAAKENQKRWWVREEMNNGVKCFIDEFIQLWEEPIRPSFINALWKVLGEDGVDMDNELKEHFFYDNVFVKEQETKVFT